MAENVSVTWDSDMCLLVLCENYVNVNININNNKNNICDPCRVTAEVCCFEGGFHDCLRIRGDCEQGVDGEANIASVNNR